MTEPRERPDDPRELVGMEAGLASLAARSCREMSAAVVRRDAREVLRLGMVFEGLLWQLRELELHRRSLEPPAEEQADLTELVEAAEDLRDAVEGARSLLDFSLRHVQACVQMLGSGVGSLRGFDSRA